MRFWRDKFQAMAAAVAFAQAGEWETAKSLLRKPIGKQIDRPATISRRPNPAGQKALFSHLESPYGVNAPIFSVQEEHDGPRVEKEKPIGKNSYLWRGYRSPLCRGFFKCRHCLASFCKGRSLRRTANWRGFLFSFAHGAFAGNLWSLLGIEAITKQPERRAPVPAPRPTRRARPRLRLSV